MGGLLKRAIAPLTFLSRRQDFPEGHGILVPELGKKSEPQETLETLAPKPSPQQQ